MLILHYAYPFFLDVVNISLRLVIGWGLAKALSTLIGNVANKQLKIAARHRLTSTDEVDFSEIYSYACTSHNARTILL